MGAAPGVDVLIVSLGSTGGLRAADDELQASLQRAGATVALARAHAPAEPRTLMLTDLAWARSARAAAQRLLAELKPAPTAVIYSSTTAALLWPRPGAVRFDATSAGNRPGRHGLWQRPLERRRLGQSPLLLPWSAGGLEEAPAQAGSGDRALVLPVPVEPSEPVGAPGAGDSPQRAGSHAESAAERRDIAAITYAANPSKKGLDRVLAAWRRVRGERSSARSEELLVAGISAEQLEHAGLHSEHDGVRVVGVLPPREYRALVRRARVFVCAPRREDYGIAQLEALADGCRLVTSPAPGPYAALPIARALDRRLVSEDLAQALRTALDAQPDDYAARARRALAPFRAASVDRVVAEELLPRLLG
jgi:glycosyltransferase involved in cell wall biosynthesis